MENLSRHILATYIFFLRPFLPPFESPLFLPTAIFQLTQGKDRNQHRMFTSLVQFETTHIRFCFERLTKLFSLFFLWFRQQERCCSIGQKLNHTNMI